MLTRSQEPIVVITVNQNISLARKRKRESLSSTTATASLADLSHTPQSKRICTQESVSTMSSTIIPEESGNVNKPTISFGSDIQQNITGMVELAAPSDQYTNDVAKHVAQKISSIVNALSGCKTKRTITKHIHQMVGSLGVNYSADLSNKTTNNLARDILKFAPWIKAPLVEDDIELLPMHEFVHFVYFVAECINLLAPEDCQPERVIVPLQPTTSKYQNCSKESGFFEAKLETCDPDSDWRDKIDLIGEGDLKRRGDDLSFLGSAMVTSEFRDAPKAFEEMGKYTEYLYGRQQNRGFIWGLAVVESSVHATLFGPNFALSSVSMDVRTKASCSQFIQLLVNWAYCDKYKLGFDPSKTYDFDIHQWVIPVDNIDEEKGTVSQKTYYGGRPYIGVSSLYGRHTRCTLATDTFPGRDYEPDYSDDNSIFIKDAWSEVDNDNFSDEVKHLRNITNGLAGKEELKGMYPELLGGGCVQVDGKDETTRGFLGEHIWKQLNNTPVYVHRRMATRGFGKDLDTVRSIPELIIVLADAMKIYTEIYKICGIYQRDISTGNILVRRNKETGEVKGMLVDFDNAIRAKDVSKEKRDRMGTAPFMSIRSLQSLECPRSMLDDWESLLYLVCWVGIYGINEDYTSDNANKWTVLEGWKDRHWELIGNNKRSDLNISSFSSSVLTYFNRKQPYWKALQILAVKLNKTIFCNSKVEEKGRGYKTGTQVSSRFLGMSFDASIDSVDPELFYRVGKSENHRQDPLMYRTNEEDAQEICRDLMEIMEMFKDKAIKLLEKKKRKERKNMSG